MRRFALQKKTAAIVLLMVLFCSSQVIFSFDYGTFSITQSSGSYWQTQGFDFHWYPVMIFGLTTYNDSDPLVMRNHPGSTNYGYFQVDEWEYQDGAHGMENGNFAIFELGAQQIEDQLVYATYITANGAWGTITINPGITFNTPPVILAQLSSEYNPGVYAVRIRNVTTTTFDIKLQREEADSGVAIPEMQIGYVALSEGTYGDYEVKKIAGVTHDWLYVPNSASNKSNAIVLGATQTYAGPDPVNLRIYKSDSKNAYIKLMEEQSNDDEMAHTGETVGLFVFYYN